MAQTVLRTKSASGNPAHQTLQYIYARVRFNDVDQINSSRFSVAPIIGVIPAGCAPLETHVRILTAFTSGDLVIGTSVSGSSAGIVSTNDITSGTTGYYVVDRYYGTNSTVDVPMYFYTATTGAGAGVADVWQYFALGTQLVTTL